MGFLRDRLQRRRSERHSTQVCKQPLILPRKFLPILFKAVEEQLGLKLERKDSPVEILVIDSIEKKAHRQLA